MATLSLCLEPPGGGCFHCKSAAKEIQIDVQFRTCAEFAGMLGLLASTRMAKLMVSAMDGKEFVMRCNASYDCVPFGASKAMDVTVKNLGANLAPIQKITPHNSSSSHLPPRSRQTVYLCTSTAGFTFGPEVARTQAREKKCR